MDLGFRGQVPPPRRTNSPATPDFVVHHTKTLSLSLCQSLSQSVSQSVSLSLSLSLSSSSGREGRSDPPPTWPRALWECNTIAEFPERHTTVYWTLKISRVSTMFQRHSSGVGWTIVCTNTGKLRPACSYLDLHTTHVVVPATLFGNSLSLSIYIYIYMYVCMYVCMYVYIYIYVYIYMIYLSLQNYL